MLLRHRYLTSLVAQQFLADRRNSGVMGDPLVNILPANFVISRLTVDHELGLAALELRGKIQLSESQSEGGKVGGEHATLEQLVGNMPVK